VVVIAPAVIGLHCAYLPPRLETTLALGALDPPRGGNRFSRACLSLSLLRICSPFFGYARQDWRVLPSLISVYRTLKQPHHLRETGSGAYCTGRTFVFAQAVRRFDFFVKIGDDQRISGLSVLLTIHYPSR
jgi:hypothetical protein